MDITSLINGYLIDKVLILIPALFVLGFIIKKTERINDKYIPSILLLVSIILSLFILGFNVDSVIQGILVTGATVLANNIFKQSTK